MIEPTTQDATLLGVAMVAATAAGLHADLPAACTAMSQPGRSRSPNPAARAQFEKDYRIHLTMQRQRAELEAMN